MSDLSSNIVEGVIWTVNGFLVIAYYAADHIQTLALAVATILYAIELPSPKWRYPANPNPATAYNAWPRIVFQCWAGLLYCSSR